MMTNDLLSNLSFGASHRVILVGTANYVADETLDNIPQVKNNIESLVGILLDPFTVGLSPSAITTIVDEPHSTSLLEKIQSVAKEAYDTLIVYYVGHGLYGDENVSLYLAASQTTDEGKAFNGVEYEKLKKIVINSPAKRKILILDCCYSGSVLEGGMSGSEAGQIVDVSGTCVLTASSANKRAMAPPDMEHTLFTGALIDVLSEGREALPSVVTIGDLFDSVERDLTTMGNAPVPERSSWKTAEGFKLAINQFGKERGTVKFLDALKALEERVNTTEAATAQMAQNVSSLSDDRDTLFSRIDHLTIEIEDYRKSSTSVFMFWIYRLRFIVYLVLSIITLVLIGTFVELI